MPTINLKDVNNILETTLVFSKNYLSSDKINFFSIYYYFFDTAS